MRRGSARRVHGQLGERVNWWDQLIPTSSPDAISADIYGGGGGGGDARWFM